MKTATEFIENLVKIDYMGDCGAFGHYPFQLFVEMKDGSKHLNALFLGGDIEAVYSRVKQYIRQDAKLIFLSVDFPACGDIPHNFVCLLAVADGIASAIALPYDSKTGQRFAQVESSELLSTILSQFETVVFS